MVCFIPVTQAAKTAKTTIDYLHKLIKRGELPCRYDQRGKLKYWYVDIESPRYQKLLSRLTTSKASPKPALKSIHPIDWDIWDAMCKRDEEIVARRCSLRTRGNYRYYIERFFKSHSHLNRDSLRQALAEYEAKETPEKDFYTAKSHLYFALMTIAKYFIHMSYETSELIRSLEYLRPKKGRTVVSRKCFTESTVRQTVQEIQTVRTKRNAPAYNEYNAALNTALLYTAFFTGARSSEICSIRLKDIDSQAQSIRLFGKGGKERYVGMCAELKQAIQVFLKLRVECDSDVLFVAERGTPLRAAYLHRRVKRAGRWINENLAPHAIRRTSITWMLNTKKLPMPLVRDAVGHSSLAVTNIYTKPTANDVIDAMKQL